MNTKLNRVRINLLVGYQLEAGERAKLSNELCANADRGINELVFSTKLNAGAYTFSWKHGLTHEPPQFSSQIYILFLDGEEIATGGIPDYLQCGEELTDHCIRSADFICQKAGHHILTLRVAAGDVGNLEVCHPFALCDISLKRRKMPKTYHSLLDDHPGRINLDAWGWLNPVVYQRAKVDQPFSGEYTQEVQTAESKNYFAADVEYHRVRATDDSYRWGANIQEFYDSARLPDGPACTMNWSKDDPIKGGDEYRHHHYDELGDEEFKQIIEDAHKRDSLIHWYICGAPHPNSFTSNKCFVGPERTPRWWLYNLAQKIARDYANYLKYGWKQCVDGRSSELMDLISYKADSKDITEYTRILWQYNPGGYYSENTGNTWGRAVPCASPGFLHCMLSHVRDDMNPPNSFEKWMRDSKYGKLYFSLQGDARLVSPNIFGGWIAPDFVVKECNDFFRQRIEEPDDIRHTSVWWLIEGATCTPDFVRRYVYGVSQDPMRCAASYELTTTGKGGLLKKMVQVRKKFGNGGLPELLARPRDARPCDTKVIQNNYLRAYFPAYEDGGELLHDLEGWGHYDGNSMSMRLSESLLSMKPESGISHFHKNSDHLEPAGYKAVYRERISILSRQGNEIEEERRWTAHNDTPYLKLDINRKSGEETVTIIGCEHYDQMKMDGTLRKSAFTEKSCPQLIEFEDTRGLRPGWAILILNSGQIEKLKWVPAKTLMLYSKPVEQECISLVFLSPGLYTSEQLPKLAEWIEKDEVEAVVGRKGTEIKNESSLPRVVVAKVKDPVGTPYLVREKGWWTFRGAEPSRERPDYDYVKIYLEPKGIAKLVRHGLIEGQVKPGWGCQYMLTLSEVKATRSGSKCRVKVFNVTPLIFAPRLRFRSNITSVKLDGKPWYYYDEDFVLLPNRPGECRVEVTYGKKTTPHLARTYALIEDTNLENNKLSFEAKLPVWCKALRMGMKFTAAIETKGKKVKEVQGGKIVEEVGTKVLLEFVPGRITVSFN